MSETLRQIMEMNVYNASTQAWEKGAPVTTDEAVTRTGGGTVKSALDEIPGLIEDAVTAIKGGVATDGDSLAKLQSKITAIQTALNSDDVDLDTLQEVVDYIKANKDALTLLGGDKIDKSSIVNDLTAVAEGKVLDARQGKALKDLISAVETSVSALQTQAETFATKSELSGVAAGAIPVISENAPVSPVDKQIWWKPLSAV